MARTRFIRICVATACIGAAMVVARAQERITISHAGLVGGVESLLIPIAEQQGLFAAHGVAADTLRGSIEQGQIGLFGSPAALQALSRGVDLKVVAAFSTGRVTTRLVARPAIRSVQDLRGKALGANGVGAGAWTMTLLALERMGLSRDRDNIRIESTGDLIATETALREGRIDAALLSLLQSEGLAAEGYRVLMDMSTVDVYGPQLVLVTTGKFLAERPQIVRGVILALTEASAFMCSPRNTQAFEAAFTAAFGSSGAPALSQAGRDLDRLNRRPLPSRERLQGIQRLMAAEQPAVGKLNLESVVQDGIVRDLDRTRAIDELFGRYGITP